MKLDVTGKYKIKIPITTMFMNTTAVISGENLITLFGESFFMNRCINDEFNPIKYIALGNASNNPKKTDMKLGNETNRKVCVCLADLNLKQLILTANFKAAQVIGTSEIGVFNDQVMISHDRFNKIDDGFLGLTGEVEVEYVFQFSTGALKGGWKQVTGQSNIFYIAEPNNVVGVCERSSNVWYYRVDNLNDLTTTRGAYFYETGSKNLYIRPRKDITLTELQNHKDIIVQVR